VQAPVASVSVQEQAPQQAVSVLARALWPPAQAWARPAQALARAVSVSVPLSPPAPASE